MKKTIDMMVQLLEKNYIPVPEGARKKDGSSSSDNKERCNALVVGSSYSLAFIIDLGALRNMASIIYLFTYMYLDNGPTIQMGDDYEIQSKRVGRIDIANPLA